MANTDAYRRAAIEDERAMEIAAHAADIQQRLEDVFSRVRYDMDQLLMEVGRLGLQERRLVARRERLTRRAA